MPDNDPIDELMIRWEDARQQGQNPQAEELCADQPQLASQLRQRIRAVLTMEAVLGVNAQEGDPTLITPFADSTPAGDQLPQIPGYEIIRVVDEGGMGVVYEAKQTALRRTVAVKMISGLRLGPTQVARFRSEAEACARLQHPNFVQIIEVGQVNGRPFYSMEFVDGGSLAQHLAQARPGPRHAAEMVCTLAKAIHTAHAAGIVHRDLKPSNILLAKTGSQSQVNISSLATDHWPLTTVPKIADFGLAKRLDTDSGHTQTGEVLGTPSYMAPEQANGQKDRIGAATDVYALGAILYEMLTGKPPFLGDSPLATLRLITSEEPIAPSRLAPATPPDLEAICLKCLEKVPAARYASAGDLAADLQHYLNDQPVQARRTGPLRRTWKWIRRHPQAVALALALAVLAAYPIVLLIGDYTARQQRMLKAEQEAPRVREILERNCFACHGQNPAKAEKNLNILDHDQLLNTERKIVVPGDPEHSRLIQRIADGSMPPEEFEDHLPRLTEVELTILKDWILGGAPPLPPPDPDNPTPPVVPYSELAEQSMEFFHEYCYKCHKFDVAKGGIKILNYRLLANVRKVIIPGKPDESELYKLITAKDVEARMPPGDEPPMPPEAIATIRQWILAGAPPFPKKK